MFDLSRNKKNKKNKYILKGKNSPFLICIKKIIPCFLYIKVLQVNAIPLRLFLIDLNKSRSIDMN